MDCEILGITVLITGGATGTGASIAKVLQNEGANVVIGGLLRGDVDCGSEKLGG